MSFIIFPLHILDDKSAFVIALFNTMSLTVDIRNLSYLLTVLEESSEAMLDAIYVDHKEAKVFVAIRPKTVFRAVFQVATTREGSGVI